MQITLSYRNTSETDNNETIYDLYRDYFSIVGHLLRLSCKMDNLDEILKEKTIHANNSEYFVFLPNDLNTIKSNSSENAVFRDSITAKNAGNIAFRKKRFDDAIKHYDMAIEMLQTVDQDMCAIELAICYQNRAAAKEQMKNYNGAVSDASKAVELNDHYAKAYFRRAKAYYGQKKYYCALQDIVQACILERFKNKTYTDMVGDLMTRIGKKTLTYCH